MRINDLLYITIDGPDGKCFGITLSFKYLAYLDHPPIVLFSLVDPDYWLHLGALLLLLL